MKIYCQHTDRIRILRKIDIVLVEAEESWNLLASFYPMIWFIVV